MSLELSVVVAGGAPSKNWRGFRAVAILSAAAVGLTLACCAVAMCGGRGFDLMEARAMNPEKSIVYAVALGGLGFRPENSAYKVRQWVDVNSIFKAATAGSMKGPFIAQKSLRHMLYFLTHPKAQAALRPNSSSVNSLASNSVPACYGGWWDVVANNPPSLSYLGSPREIKEPIIKCFFHHLYETCLHTVLSMMGCGKQEPSLVNKANLERCKRLVFTPAFTEKPSMYCFKRKGQVRQMNWGASFTKLSDLWFRDVQMVSVDGYRFEWNYCLLAEAVNFMIEHVDSKFYENSDRRQRCLKA